MTKSLLLLPCLAATLALAAPSSPPPPEEGGTGASSRPERRTPAEVSFYNEGTLLLFRKEWAAAQRQFEAALAVNDEMADAHNNLAYVLRKQGEAQYDRSLAHYNRALALKPRMAETYMYRGVLHALAGRPDLARADHATLVRMKSKLAPHLKRVIDTGREEEPEQFYGVTKKRKT